MREVILNNDTFRAYQNDRAKLLEGRDLTDDERKWLMDFDYRSLYASGVHFFLLNGFVMKTWPGDRSNAGATYRKDLEDLGYPDFAT
jgi:hypothetical protein